MTWNLGGEGGAPASILGPMSLPAVTASRKRTLALP